MQRGQNKRWTLAGIAAPDDAHTTGQRTQRRRAPESRWRRLGAPLSYAAVVVLVIGMLAAFSACGQPTSSTPTTRIPTSTTTLLANDHCPLTTDALDTETFLLNLLNRHRADAHVAPLALSPRLTAVSHAHSCDMFQRQRLDHLGSDGSTPGSRIATIGVSLNTWGENIGTADGYGLDGGITTIDNAMMAEPLTSGNHHYNIVNRAFTQVGLGIIFANGQVWLTEDFLG